MLIKKSVALSTMTVAVLSFNASSQTNETGIFIRVDSNLSHDDNVYRVYDSLVQSDTFISVAPELKLVGGIGKQRFQVTYKGDYSKYADLSDADFADHDFRGKIYLDHTLRLNSSFEAGYLKEHENAGSIDRVQLNISEFNKYTLNFFGAGIAYGQESATGRLELSYRRTDQDYTNNNLDYLDSVSDRLSVRFTYRVGPKTKLYAEASTNDIDYTLSGALELDNSYRLYRAGLSWDFTNKLSGDINIGYQDRDYDQPLLRDINGIAYYGKVNWYINTYTSVELNASRESIDSSIENAGGFIRTSFGTNVKHELTELLSFTGTAGYSKDQLIFSSNREDERLAYQVGIEYSILRNLALSGTYTYQKRNSTVETADFKANTIGLSITYLMED